MAVYASTAKVDGKPLLEIIGTPALTAEQWAEIQSKVTKGGANIINLRGRSSFQSPAYVSIEMIAAAMGGKPFRWPAGTYVIWEELAPEARAVIEKQGVVYTDCEGDLVTSIVNNKDCVFTCYDEKGCCYCAIEKAYRDGKTDFYKPVSCHLYPIRVGNYGVYKAVNYNRWDVCKAAVLLGRKENLPVYRFLKEPLIRKFGEDWYAELELVAEEMKKQNLL